MIIKDKNYEIKFTINTLCVMTSEGIDVMNLGEMKINMLTIRDLLMYGLRHENKKITKNQAGDLIDEYFEDGGTFNQLVEEIMKALAKSLGEEEKNNEDSEVDEEKN